MNSYAACLSLESHKKKDTASMEAFEQVWEALRTKPALMTAAIAIPAHVVFYNFTTQLEFYTRLFTKIFGKVAIYFYALLLVASALVRDYYVKLGLEATESSLLIRVPYWNIQLKHEHMILIGQVLFVSGIALNLWTLKALGIKGMYNGDSFGWLMESPVTDGPFQYFQDPQYVGTSIALLGSALYYQSYHGVWLAVWTYFIFSLSVFVVEAPHMDRIYANREKHDLYGQQGKGKEKGSAGASKGKGKKAKKDD